LNSAMTKRFNVAEHCGVPELHLGIDADWINDNALARISGASLTQTALVGTRWARLRP
jgi:hypothetical protein